MGQTVFYGMNSVVTNSIISILWFSNYQYSFHIKTLVLYVGLALRLFLFFSYTVRETAAAYLFATLIHVRKEIAD